MPDDVKSTTELALLHSRQRVEESLDALRRSVRERTGAGIERSIWTLPLLAAAAGFSIALMLRRRRRERDRDHLGVY
jgi:hypothetical protein